jgi:hypothetical protein
MARAMSKDTGAERISIRPERITSSGRFSQDSFTLGTRMARISLGDRDRSVEDLLVFSIMTYLARDSITGS